MDDLSIALSACCTGCCVNNTIKNHFMYANDLAICSPSSLGLRALISLCEKIGISHEIRFNHKKSAIMICRGKYMYTAQLWWNHTAYSLQRINVCYNNILRRLLRRPRYCYASGLFAEFGIPNGKAVIRNLIYKFITRLNESTNDWILAILSSDIRWTSCIRHYWVKTLYVHHDLV